MALIPVSFDANVQKRVRARGISLPFQGCFDLLDDFAVEAPCVVQATIAPTNHFRIGAFSASYGGMLKNVDIGRYCSFARGVQIGWDEHPADWVTSSMLGYVNDHHGWETALGSSRPIARHFNSQRGTTKIGHDVWIGLNSFIRNGVTIGNGAVIGAHAVVVKDVPPFSILAGHPTRLIRPRFDGQIAERLAAVEWWTYNLYEVPQHLLGLPTDFVSYMEDEIAAGRLTPYQPGWLGPVELGMAVASATI